METESSSSLSSSSDDDDAADIFICILLYLSMMINVPRANMDMVTSRNMAAYQQVKIQILIMKISFVAPQGLMACALSSRGGLQRLQMHGYLSGVSVVQENAGVIHRSLNNNVSINFNINVDEKSSCQK